MDVEDFFKGVLTTVGLAIVFGFVGATAYQCGYDLAMNEAVERGFATKDECHIKWVRPNKVQP